MPDGKSPKDLCLAPSNLGPTAESGLANNNTGLLAKQIIESPANE